MIELIMIFMIFIILLMQTIIKIRHLNRDLTVPIVVAKIPIWLVAQVQVEEIVFMAVRNFKASLHQRPLGAAAAYCISLFLTAKWWQWYGKRPILYPWL